MSENRSSGVALFQLTLVVIFGTVSIHMYHRNKLPETSPTKQAETSLAIPGEKHSTPLIPGPVISTESNWFLSTGNIFTNR